ncbi:MAG: hypothetical protein R3208_03545, partial [Ketobacteraceae bacterium]|nr:hypothetical protein [Ketobacteraceae bacterium]
MSYTQVNISEFDRQNMESYISSGDYPGFYRYVAGVVESTAGSDPRITNWLNAAASINSDDGSFYSEFVRHATAEAAYDEGHPITPEDFQLASNSLAETVATDILQRGFVPDIDTIIATDVQAAVTSLGLNPEGWAGTAWAWAPPQAPFFGLGLEWDGQLYQKLYESFREREIDEFTEMLVKWADIFENAFQGMWGYVSSSVNDFYAQARNWVQPRDPLALDLDGDGIETIGADGSVLFDHQNDDVKNATGWIDSGDGLLVMDRNGNGTIDDGTELFGDNTIKSDGSTATDGYDALSDLDSNNDGQVDASDAQFADLRVWQDANSDGISQADELHTLEELGIQSISTGSTESNINTGDGNVIAQQGVFTYADGTTGTTGSLDLAENNFYREFENPIDVPEELKGLPDMQGSGAVRDLQHAAATSTQLQSTLAQYSQATSRDEQMALLDQLILEWANSANHSNWEERLIEETYAFERSDGIIQPYTLAFYWPGEALPVGASSSDGGSDSFTVSLNPEPTQEEIDLLHAQAETLRKVQILEAFNDTEFFQFGATVSEVVAAQQETDTTQVSGTFSVSIGSTSRSYSFSGTGTGISSNVKRIIIQTPDIALSAQQTDFINQSYDALMESIYSSLLVQTRLRPFLDAVGLGVDEQGELQLDFSGLNALVQEKITAGDPHGYIDIVEFINTQQGSMLLDGGWNIDWGALSQGVNSLEASAQNVLSEFGFVVTSGSGNVQTATEALIAIHDANENESITYSGSNGIDVVTGSNLGDVLLGGGGNDIVSGGAGNDNVQGQDGDDTVLGGDGDDYVYGQNGNDRLEGGNGR